MVWERYGPTSGNEERPIDHHRGMKTYGRRVSESDYFFLKNSSQRIFNHHRPMFRQSRTALQDRTADLVRRFVSSSKLLLCEWMSNAAKSVWF